jgi:hypothetical protein
MLYLLLFIVIYCYLLLFISILLFSKKIEFLSINLLKHIKAY